MTTATTTYLITATESVINNPNSNIKRGKHGVECQPPAQLPDNLKPVTTADYMYHIFNDYYLIILMTGTAQRCLPEKFRAMSPVLQEPQRAW